ncbi:monovalent cation/H+ antiporter complex subunit F [Peloplasma aerotolerans]|jgi:multicomponent Na+:H+ antiporter subunit F|uniref:Monovalent cation/H+ antiporter complex subunit F n=1 Tax=Peloplasma aerotolerans TaxID=3044389 RepID=A0AAW6UC10_9MOLU|nr:monovalent cation/H+ antiporter complex subunit F [Mariniplasma sp. M4Ah]MCR3906354.1 monovalent cation/H+ antiporter complex subunit F [Mycoplasmatota bacterium]MDI6453031.1 monovalent cation/H+ antiporter complex subunit F [Mariniplasma sp. M4Ah]
MTTLQTFLLITLLLLVLAMILSFVQLVRGKTLWDRILMLNLISAKVILFIAVYAIYMERVVLLDIAISYGIIGFLTMTLLSKFIMTGGREK